MDVPGGDPTQDGPEHSQDAARISALLRSGGTGVKALAGPESLPCSDLGVWGEGSGWS